MSYISIGPAPLVGTSSVRKTTTASVTSAGLLVVGAEPARIGFYIWNNSANSVYLSFDTVSSSATPTVILATFATFINIGTVCWTGPIAAIRNGAATGTVTIWELLAV